MIGKIFPRKLNKESDPSLIKPDEMLDALNVLASGSEGNDASIVKKAHGNKEVSVNDGANTFAIFNSLPASEDVVGHVVDDSSNRIYYFTKGPSTNSVYMAEKFSEEDIKVTLLLRDADLGFDKYVAADVIKTPKKTVQSLFLDGDVSGQAGDSTSIFDFEADDSTTEIIENQTALIVSTAPQLFTNPIYDGSAKTFFGQMAIKNLGDESGQVNLSYSHDSGAIENYTFSYDISGSDSANVQVGGGATVIVNFRVELNENIDEEDSTYGFNIFVEEVPTPYTQTPLDVSYLRTISLEFIIPAYPLDITVTPIISGVGPIDGDNANFVTQVASQGVQGAIGGMACPESSFAQYFGVLQVEVTLDNTPTESLYFLPPMSVRASMIGGTDGNYTGSNQGFFQTVSDIYANEDPLMIIEFPLTAESFAGGNTALVQIPFGKSWDSSSGFEDEIITGQMSFAVKNEETGQTFGMLVPDGFGGSVSTDDSPYGWMRSLVDYDYTIADVPTPPSVSATSGLNEFINIPSRSYSVIEDAQKGGGFKYVDFNVVNTGESDGYFNVSIDPFKSVHQELREIIAATGAFGGVYNTINYVFQSLYNAITIEITTPNGTTSGLKPSFRTSFSDNLDPSGDTNQPFDFFNFINNAPAGANLSLAFHATEADQHQVLLGAGETATVRITVSNLSMETYPKIPLPVNSQYPGYSQFEGMFGSWDVGTSDFISGDTGDQHGLIVYPKNGSYSYPFANYDRTKAAWARDAFSSAFSFAQDLASVGQGSVAESYGINILASPLLSNVMSEVYIRTTPTQGDGFAGEVINGVGKFYVGTDSPTEGEIIVVACGNYADPGTNILIGGAPMNQNIPLINSYMPHDEGEELPPGSIGDASANSEQATKGNIYREIYPGQESSIPSQSINHYGRKEGAPMAFYIMNIGLQKDGISGTVQITGTPKYNNDYGLNGPHGGTDIENVFGTSSLTFSGSIGTSYAGAYLTAGTEEMEDIVSGIDFWAGAGGVNGTGGPIGGLSSGVRDFFRQNIPSIPTNFIQEGGPFVVLPQLNSGLELNSNDGTSTTWGKYRRISQTMSQGSVFYVEPVHMMSYNFHNKGQRSPSVDNTSLQDTSGIVTSYTISANGFYNDDFASSNELCWEQAHDISTYYVYHSRGEAAPPTTGPDDGDTTIPFVNAPPPAPNDRGTLPPDPSTDSSSSNSVNLPSNTSGTDPQREDVNNQSKRRTQVGLSSKKKKRY